jgi:predicted outer membrane repeat protein
MKKRICIATAMVLAALWLGLMVGWLHVAQAEPSATIQFMIDAAPDGGTVNIPSGTYTESLTVNKTLTLTGVSSATTIIQAVSGQRVITVTAGHNLRLENLTVTGGNPPDSGGGGIYVAGGNLQIVNCHITNNSATYGGGVFQEDASKRVDVTNSWIALNTTSYDGGAMYVSGSVGLTNTQVLSNTANRHGGGLHVQDGRTDLNGGLFSNNRALGGNGGAVNANNGISITGTQFISNTANDSGGALLQWNVGYTVTVINARFERNTAKNYGGGASVNSTLLISNSTFVTNTVDSGNTNDVYGGGVSAGGISQILASTFVGNSARCISCSFTYGGGMYTPQPATIQDSTFDRNDAWLGGGVYGDNTAITVTHSTFKNNIAGYGGAIDADVIQVTGSDFLRNRAVNKGGALQAQDITLSGTRFISNTTGAPGGGMWVGNRLDAVNTLFAGNQAGRGAAVLQLEGSQYTLRHVTIAHPSPGGGPAILMTSGAANITNTVIANYTVGISQTGGILSADYDLFFTATPTQTSGGTMNLGSHNLNANPQFVNPAAGDYHLADGSPAIDAGANVGVTTDLDGVTRPQGKGYDIGAYETPPSSGPCYARLLSNSVTYTSTNAVAIQAAVDAAPSGDTLKVAGTCAGVQSRAGISQTVYISKSLTMRGGYTTTNWITSDPVANPTVLDAEQGGRVVYLTGGSGINVTLEDLTMRGGSINNDGGGIYDDNVTLTLSNTIVRYNVPSGMGGGLFVRTGNAMVSGGQIFSNTAYYGGGVYVQTGNTAVSGGQIFHNTAKVGGGVFAQTGSAIVVSRTQILSNTTSIGGGGAYNNGGALMVIDSIVSNNAGSWWGGGIVNNGGVLTLTNSTLSGNQAISPTYGGGAINQTSSGSATTINNSTIVSNTAGNAARSGIWLQHGTLDIQNSIVAHNGVTNNVQVESGAALTSLGYNLTNSDVGTPFTATGDLIDTNPLLGPLQDNGGSTWTHALLPGSPALDRIPFGVNGCGTTITTDQRGQPRPGTFTHMCDMGAYEAQGIHYLVYLPVMIK